MKKLTLLTVAISFLFLQGTSAQGLEADTARFMNDDPFNLEMVVVTATRTQKKVKDIPVVTQVITAQQIEERGATNIQDLLVQEVPGLNFQEVGYGTDIDIQGLGAKHVLFLVDGERIAGENSGNIDYSRINLTNVERIEIVKGASSALYGSQAMGGVINIITRDAKKKLEVSAGAKYAGLYQRNFEDTPKDHAQYKYRVHLDKPNLNANVSIGTNLGRLTMNTDIIYKSADAYQLYDKSALVKYFPDYDVTVTEEVSDSPTSISGYEDLQASHKMRYKFNDKLTAGAYFKYYLLNKYDFTADNVFDNSEDFTFGANAQWQFADNQHLAASVHVDNYSRYDKFEKKDGRRLEYKNNIAQPRLVYTNQVIDRQTITAGAEFYNESLYSDKFEADVYQSKSQWYATLFAQDDWVINNYWSTVIGVRADVHKEYGANFTPKVSIMYKNFPFTLRFNYARGYRSPTLKELYMDWDHLGMFWIYGNSELQPETNNYISLSAEYVNSWININLNGYSNWFRNKIEGIWSADQTEYHYVNADKSHLAGFELMAKLKLQKHVNVHGTYNYLYTRTESEGVYHLSTSAPHSGTVRAEFNSHVKDFQTVVNVTGVLLGQKNFSVEDELDVVTSEGVTDTVTAYYDAHVDAYSLWDVTLTQYLFRQFRLTLGVSNVFDYTSDHVTFNTSTTPGRNLFVAFSYTF